MRIGMVTDSLGHLPLDELLRTAAELGIEMLEFPCGNWSSAPHVKLDALLDSAAARGEFMAKLRDHGIALSALNCSGNPLHPGELGRQHQAVTSKTITAGGDARRRSGGDDVRLSRWAGRCQCQLGHHGLAAGSGARAGLAVGRGGDPILERAGGGGEGGRRGQAVSGTAWPAERLQRGDAVPSARCGGAGGGGEFRSQPSVLDGRRSAGRDARAGAGDLSRACQGHAGRSGEGGDQQPDRHQGDGSAAGAVMELRHAWAMATTCCGGASSVRCCGWSATTMCCRSSTRT